LRLGIGLAVLFAFGLMASGAFGETLSVLGTTSTDTTPASSASTTDTTSAPSTDTASSSTDTSSSSTDTTTTATYTPTITTDQQDYSPGSTVTITGSGWPAGDSVTVFTNDTIGKTWSKTDQVTADANGGFTDQVTLPNTFISDYDVTASDALGLSATTTFTDAPATQVQGQNATPCTSPSPCPWQNNNLLGWQELQSIPGRVFFTVKNGDLNQNVTVDVDFDHSKTTGAIVRPGLIDLTNWALHADDSNSSVALTWVTMPHLTVSTGDVWTYEFTVKTPNATGSPYVTFTTKMAAGAHAFTGSSLAFGGVQVHTPAAASPTLNVDVGVTKTATCPAGGSASTGGSATGPVSTTTCTANPGQTVTYTINYSNAASAQTTATGVALTDTLPSGVTPTAAFVTTCNSTPGCSIVANTVTWPVSNLAAGASGSVNIPVTVNSGTAGTRLDNQVAIGTANIDNNGANDNYFFSINSVAAATKHDTSTSVTCTPSTLSYGGNTSCAATVTDTASTGKTSPTGTVTFDDGTAGGNFSSTTCTLTAATSSSSNCTANVTYTPSAAGSPTITGTYGGDGTHNGSNGNTGLTVNKADTSVSITWADPQAYNGNTHPATATVTGPVAADNPIGSPAVSFEYFSGNTAGTAGTGSATAPTNAGNYTVRASYAGNTNYNSSSATKTITINPVDTQVNITWADPQAYNGNTHPATATVTGPVAADNPIGSPAVSFEYFSGNTAGTAGTGSTTAPTVPGIYTVRATFAGNNNYNGSSATKTITIQKANSSVSISWTTPQTYDTNPHPATAQANGVNGQTNLSPAPSLEYFTGNTAGTAGTGSATAPTNAGTYTVRATFDGNGNYYGSLATKTIVINKANQTITFGSLADLAYGSADFTVNATASSSLPVSFSASGACTVSGSPGGTWTVHLTSTGTCTITASQGGDNNWYAAANVPQAFMVNAGVGTVAYIGQTVFVSSGSSSTTVQAHLTASVVADGGSIAGAKVTFTDLLTHTVLAKGVPVSPVANSSEPTGTADTIVTLSTGNYGSNMYLIEVKLDTTAGSFYKNCQQLDALNAPGCGTATSGTAPWNAAHPNLVAMIPQTTNTLTGGALLGANGCPTSTDPCKPAGTYGDATNVSYAAGMGWTSKGTNPQGQIQLTLQRSDGTYYIKSNSITSVAFSNLVNGVNKDVTIYTKASIYKVTASGNTSVDGNVTLRMDAHDGGQAGDTVGFTILSSKTSALYYSNNWVYDGTTLAWRTLPQAVSSAGGCAIRIG
jgi:hypothetical protein